MLRTKLSDVALRAQMSISRASVREVDDEHLMQEIKQADVYHSETPSDFERWQMVGLTAVPLKQDQEQQQQQQQQETKSKKSENGGLENTQSSEWNHNQPGGKSAEAVMIYPGANRAHPIGIVDDRRVRPYKMAEGESAHYSADGSGQMGYHKADGYYLLTCNNPAYDNSGQQQSQQQKKEVERFVSVRHVNKPQQSRTIRKGETIPDPKHEGETVNTEVRVTKTRIEFRVGDSVVGYYDKNSSTWMFKGTIKLGDENADHAVRVMKGTEKYADVTNKQVYAVGGTEDPD